MDDDVVITTFAQRPEYAERIYEMADIWPDFMTRDLVANALLWQVVAAFGQLCVLATTPAGEPVARGLAIPFDLAYRSPSGELPAKGWDQVLVWGMQDRLLGRRPDTLSALEIAIARPFLGRGLSGRMLAAIRDAARHAGFRELVAPVRPTEKHLQPRTPMLQYAATTRDDGLPADPWLRVHVRAGGVIDSVAPAAMVIAGSLAQWRSWTGLPFDTAGPVEVPQALVPVRCDPEHDQAVYVEPAVWVRHPL